MNVNPSSTRETASIARPASRAVAGLAAAAWLIGALVAPITAHPDQPGQWNPATSVDPGGLLGINTAAGEGCPYESPDGHLLFFASTRVAGAVSLSPRSRHSPTRSSRR